MSRQFHPQLSVTPPAPPAVSFTPSCQIHPQLSVTPPALPAVSYSPSSMAHPSSPRQASHSRVLRVLSVLSALAVISSTRSRKRCRPPHRDANATDLFAGDADRGPFRRPDGINSPSYVSTRAYRTHRQARKRLKAELALPASTESRRGRGEAGSLPCPPHRPPHRTGP